MCGIAGWFTPGPAPFDAEKRLTSMLTAIAHRGPDGSGQRLLPGCALGHVRLAIIDLDMGAQPMETGGITISYNGEIYNYRELRAELERGGYIFRTHSDTEVILAIYRRHGWRALSRLRGMYAIALWDARKQLGHLIRDPLGIKPLFYRQLPDGGVVFASEAKAILAHGHRATLDEGALHLLMNFRYLPGEHTLFKGVRQLPPGGVMTWDTERGLRERRLPAMSYPALAPAEAMRESVRIHLTSDVEVGAYLSGGMDSAIVTALARDGGVRRTFTLDVGDDPREAENASASATLLGVENIQSGISGNLAHELPDLIRHLEVPKINALQVSRLARLAGSHVKVVLSGLGGDELFLGYNMHRILHAAVETQRHIPGFLARMLGTSSAGLLRRMTTLPWSEAERVARMLTSLGHWPRVYGLVRNVWDTPSLRERIYGPRLLDCHVPDAFAWLEEAWPDTPDPVAASAAFEWRHKLVNDLLWQEDRCSMAVGLEVRVPFVDERLHQCVAGIPRRELMPRGRAKAYMKAIAKDVLPDEILQRRKSGFQVDAPDFFCTQLMPMARTLLSEERLKHHGLFNPEFVRQVMADRPRKALRWHFFMLYLMLMTHLWLEEFES